MGMKFNEKSNILRTNYTKQTILTISDCHFPYQHPDTIDFLEELKYYYEPDLVVSLGDLADFHNISFHESDPDLDSAGTELLKMRKGIKALEKLCPNMFIVGSNHGDLPLRKFKAHGLPKQFLRPYNDIYGVQDGWIFVDDLTITEAGQPDLHIAHSIKKNALQVAQQRGQRFIQGHYHTDFKVEYAGNPHNLLWGCTAGFLIDKKSLAFSYDKLNVNRPVIGTVVIENGIPSLIPMILNKSGRWIGELV